MNSRKATVIMPWNFFQEMKKSPINSWWDRSSWPWRASKAADKHFCGPEAISIQGNTWDLCLITKIFPKIMTSFKWETCNRAIKKMNWTSLIKLGIKNERNSFISSRLSLRESICTNSRGSKATKSLLRGYANSLIRWRSRKVPLVILREVSKT